MKKYFMKETSEEVKFGDIITLNLTKTLENGSTHHQVLDCKVLPEAIPMLLEEGVIEEKEIEVEAANEEEEENLIEFTEALMNRLDCIVSELSNITQILKKQSKTSK